MRQEDLRPHLVIDDKPTIRNRVYDGGGGTYPRDNYQSHARRLGRDVDELKAIFAKAKDDKNISRLYYRIALPENQSVLTTTGLQIEKDLHVSLLASPEKHIGYVSTSADQFSMLVEQLETYKNSPQSTGKSKFAILESIGPIPPGERISSTLKTEGSSSGLSQEVLLTVFPDLNPSDKIITKKALDEYFEQHGGKVQDIYESSEGVIIQASVKAGIKSLTALAEAFPMVQSIDPVEEVLETSSVRGDSLPPDLKVASNPGKAKVCIFDSGVVKGSAILDDSLIAHEEPIGPPYSCEHGTFVASRIIFGDSLRDQIASERLQPDVKVLSVCMISHNDIGARVSAKGEGFLRILRDTVKRWHKEIKVYNLSMNMVLPDSHAGSLVTDDSVGPVAAEIDKLSKEFDVLFVLTTGNYPIDRFQPLPNQPYPNYFASEECRLCRPAEAMLALTVGSFAARDNGVSLARRDMPSPFTRRGPGFAGYRKPDLSAHGGNLTESWKPFNDLSVAGLSADGTCIAYGNGTSFAAPLVSRLAALLFANLPNATVNLVRAMLVHFTSLPEELKAWNDAAVVDLLGNGFIDGERLLASNRWDQSFLFQGKVGFREILELPFYIPDALVSRKGSNKLRVRVTIVFAPETNRVLKQGYCKSHLQTKIQKIDGKGKTKDVPVGDSVEVITDKYSTIIRCDKVFSREIASGDWKLIIEHKSRWKLSDPQTPFAAVISVIDPKNEKEIDISLLIQTAVPNRYKAVTKVTERIRV